MKKSQAAWWILSYQQSISGLDAKVRAPHISITTGSDARVSSKERYTLSSVPRTHSELAFAKRLRRKQKPKFLLHLSLTFSQHL